MTQNNEGWQEVTPEFYEFKEAGQELIGILSDKSVVNIRGTEVNRWTFNTKDGMVSFLGGVALDPMLERIEPGTLVKLVFTGVQPTAKGTQVKTFRVFVKES